VDNQTLVVEDLTLEDIEADNQTLVVEDLNILKKEILNLLELENPNLQEGVKVVTKRIIRAEEKTITVQAVKMAKNKPSYLLLNNNFVV
jgi:hypothetical protein